MNQQFTYTTQAQIRAAFWEYARGMQGVSRKKITSYDEKGKMYNTDTRSAFVFFVDYLAKSGQISSELAARVTLSK